MKVNLKTLRAIGKKSTIVNNQKTSVINKTYVFSEKAAHRTLLALIGLYVLIYSFIAVIKFLSFSFEDFDLAVHDQIMWSVVHGSLFSSILGINFLGGHAHFIVFLLAPVYKLFPHPFTLLFLQTLALGLSVYPLYLLAKDVLGYRWAFVVSFAYLFYPALAFTNLFEYHPTVFATLFLMIMFYYFHKQKFRLFVLFMILSLLCQENIPLVIVALGFYALFRRRSPRWYLVPILGGVGYFLFCLYWLMPHFNKNTIQFISLYGYLGSTYAQIATNLIKHPILVLKIMFSHRNLSFFWEIFYPLSFIPFLSPLSLLLVLPLFLQHLLSFRSTEVSIYYHYTAEMIPLIFIAFVFGLNNLLKLNWVKRQERLFQWYFFFLTLVAVMHLGPFFRLPRYCMKVFDKKETSLIKEEFLKKIPADAPVVATFQFLSHLSGRPEIHSIHHQFSGFYTLSNKPFKLPETVRYALLDFDDSITFMTFYKRGNYINLLRFFSEGTWGVVDVKDNIVLFVKDAVNQYPLYRVLENEPTPVLSFEKKVEGEVEFLGIDIHEQKDEMLHLTLYWRALKKMNREWNIFFDFLNSDGVMQYEMFRPLCYRIYPTQAWKPGEIIEEQVYMIVPKKLSGRTLSLTMGFFDYTTGEIIRCTNTNDPLGRIFISDVEFR